MNYKKYTGYAIKVAYGRWEKIVLDLNMTMNMNIPVTEKEFYRFIEWDKTQSLFDHYGLIIISAVFEEANVRRMEVIQSPHHETLIKAHYIRQEEG